MSVETAIATAWIHRAPGSRAHARVLDPRRAVGIRNLTWGGEECDPEAGDFPGEEWRPLRWACGLAPARARATRSRRAAGCARPRATRRAASRR